MIFHVIFTATGAGILVHLWVSRSAGHSASRVVEVSLLYFLSIQWGVGRSANFFSLYQRRIGPG